MAVDPQQAALAAAVAQHGSAGIQQAAADTGAAGKQAALSGAADRAGLINAPTDFLKQAASSVAQPYNNAAKSSANTTAAINAYTGSLKGANDNYMSQLQAAIPLAQAEVDKAGGAQNFSQMLQLYNLEQQQKLNAPKLQAAQDATDLANNQKTVLNKILSDPDKTKSQFAVNVISSNASQTLPEALAALDSEDGKSRLKKAGIKDDGALRQLLTEYYTDPTSYSALQGMQAAAIPPPAAAPPAPGGSNFAAAGKALGYLPQAYASSKIADFLKWAT